MNLRKIQQLFSSLLLRIFQIIVLICVYFPIILGILYPMIFLIPIFYCSGVVLGSPFGLWLSAYYFIYPNEALSLVIIEVFIFLIGCALFFVALIQLVQARQRRENIVQVGIYHYIRHPQHLGIIVMAFPFALYIPWINDFGIRVGDLVTWMIFTLLLVIYSDIEDYRLQKRFPVEFSVYQAKTGFIFPKIIQFNLFQLKWMRENRFLKYSFLLVMFIVFLIMLQFIVEDLMRNGILVASK
ncbi:MAG: methyltransferase family protein [Candidatus Hodarchaeota archaeon]